MKQLQRYSLAAFLAAALAAAPAIAQDKAKAPAAEKKAASKGEEMMKGVKLVQPKKLLENDKVLVTEVIFKPGEGGGIRERPARVTRALYDGTMERIMPDGRTEKVTWKKGEVRWQPKETFGNRNAGTSEMGFYVVTLK